MWSWTLSHLNMYTPKPPHATWRGWIGKPQGTLPQVPHDDHTVKPVLIPHSAHAGCSAAEDGDRTVKPILTHTPRTHGISSHHNSMPTQGTTIITTNNGGSVCWHPTPKTKAHHRVYSPPKPSSGVTRIFYYQTSSPISSMYLTITTTTT